MRGEGTNRGKGTKPCEGEVLVRDYYVCEGLLRSGLLRSDNYVVPTQWPVL